MNYENFTKAIEGLAHKYQKTNPGMHVSVLSSPGGLVITHGVRAELREDWVETMLEEIHEGWRDSKCVLSDLNRKIMVFEFDDSWGDHGVGIAKCSPADSFDERVGQAVAFAHFRGYNIPDFV